MNLRTSSITRVCALLLVIAGAVVLASGSACKPGGEAGDRCNALVLQDECHAGLFCKAASCTESYCCPKVGASTDPHCNAEGCPDPDAGAPPEADAATDG